MNYPACFLCLLLSLSLIPVTQAYNLISIYDTENNRPIIDIELAPLGESVIAAEGSLYILNFSRQEVTKGWAATTVDLSDDGTYIATGSGINVCLFTKYGMKLWCDENFPGGAKDILISKDEFKIIVGSNTRSSIYLYTLAGELQWTQLVGSPIYAISTASDYVVEASDPTHFSSYELNGNQRFHHEYFESEKIYPMFDVAASADGYYILGGLDEGNRGRIIQFSQWGSELWEYPVDGLARNVAISSTGSFFAAGTRNILEKSGSIYYFSFNHTTNNGTELWHTSAGSPVNCLDMTPDGSFLAVGLQNKNIQLYTRTGAMILDYTAHDGITTIALSDDGRYLAAGTQKGEIYYFSNGIQTAESTPTGVTGETVTIISPPIITGTIPQESPTQGNPAVTSQPSTLHSVFLYGFIGAIILLSVTLFFMEHRKKDL